MIIIEITSDETLKLFEGIPPDNQKTISKLYETGLKYSRNKPHFIKMNCLELIKYKFMQKKFKSFDVIEILDHFMLYFKKLEKEQKNMIQLGFKEDMEEILFEYLNCK